MTVKREHQTLSLFVFSYDSRMPTNLELKATFQNLKSAEKIARAIGAKRRGVLRQTDTYFKVARGRLKLREMNGARAELIYYVRRDARSKRYSRYEVIPIRDATSVKRLCRILFGQRTVIKKTRILYLYKNARIHIDRVGRLGSYLEFEVIVEKGKKQAQWLMSQLMKDFGISKRSIRAGSYSDLLLSKLEERARFKKVRA